MWFMIVLLFIFYKVLWFFSIDVVFFNGMENCEEEVDILDLNDKLVDGYL